MVMKQQTVQRARDMLEAVLGGQSFSAAGKRHGVGRSTAEREVKALVRLACAQTGIAGVDQQALATLQGLRQSHLLVLQALQVFEPGAQRPRRQWNLDAHEIAAGADRLKARSRNGARDVALLYVLFTTGAKPVEIGRLQVRDYLGADGNVRRRSTLRPEATVNAHARPLFFVSERACLAVDDYLRQRLQRHHGIGSAATAYRGLDPLSPLFLTDDGRRFEIRRRSSVDARTTCRLMSATYHAIFERAGWAGLTTQQARRMVAERLLAKGTPTLQAAELLGLSSAAGVRRLLGPRRVVDLGAAVAELA